MTADPLAGLNAEQRAAAEAVRGPVCILAGAGTGKTRTVTHRIAHQIRTGTARADQVLAVTFTDKAAGELRSRLGALGVPPVRAATFHAAAWAQLRYFLTRAREPVPGVLASKLRLLAPVARRLGVEARDLASEIEWAKARLLDPDGYAAAAGAREPPLEPARMAQVYADYEAAKAEGGLLDYEDMLLRTTHLLARDPAAAAEVRGRYRFLTVDEYQDVNPAQHALLHAWLGDSRELCVVGDDDQTIYTFTGATSRYLVDFPREFPGARVVALRTNYRSTGPVLDLANRVLWTKPAGQRRRLVPALRTGDAPAPAFVEYADADTEVDGVVATCARLVAEGVPPGEIAVLYRVNAQSEAFEVALREAGLPVTVRGDEGFFARAEVRQALRVLAAARGRPEDPEDLPGGVEALPLPADRQVEKVLRRAGLYDATEPRGAVARERRRNVGALVEAAARQVASAPETTYEAVVDDLLARAQAGSDAPDDAGAVTLATLHRAKGAEFDAVFLVALEERLLPISYATTDAAVEEERRLLYVGVTRARRHLTLSWARSRIGWGGRAQTRRPSRLLYNLGDGAPQKGAPQRGALPRAPAAAHGGTTGRRGESVLAQLTGRQAALAGRLRAWRAERARRDEVPAFVVCSDRTLAALAASPPHGPDDLLAVPGFGRTKVDRYGDELLQVLRAADREA